MEQAQALFDAGQWPEAEDRYRNELASNPDNTQALYMLALVRQQRGAAEEALELMQKAAGLDPENPSVLFAQGMMLASFRRLDAARDSLLRVIQLDPFNVEAHNGLAFIELAASNFAAAENAANMALGEDPKNAQAMVYLGSAKLEQGDTTKAISYFQEALKEAPKHQSAQILLGRAFLEAKNYSFAAQCFQNVLEVNSSVPQAWEYLGQAQAGAGQHVDAANSFRAAMGLGVRKPSMIRALAEAERAAGNEEVAEKILETAANPKRDRSTEELARASVFIARGKPREALQILQNYGGFQVDMMKASALEQVREFTAAIDLVAQHLDSDEFTDEAHLAYARVLAKAGRESESNTIVDEMMAREEPPVAAQIFRGFQLCRVGDVKGIEMLQSVEKVEELDEVERRRVHRILASTFDRLGQFDRAAEYFEKTSGRVSGAHVVAGSVAVANEAFLDSSERPAFAGRESSQELPEDPVFILAWPGSGHEWLMAGLGGQPGIMLVADKPETQMRRRTLISQPAGLEVLKELTPAAATEIAAAYWQDLARGGLEPQGRQTLDSMWISAQMLPTIAAIFPDSKVIVVSRDPAEIVLEWFRGGYADLPEMAEYYRDQQQYLAQFRQWVPLKFIDVNGDALVAEPESELSSLVNTLDLHWDESARKRLEGMRAAARPFNGHASDYQQALEAPLGILGAQV